MAELGSIYDADPRRGERGRDLRVAVDYPAWALGDDDGAWVDVADTVEIDGEEVLRTPTPFDRPGKLLLRLPASFPEGGCIRLRGQGETPRGGGPAGDLLLAVSVDRRAKRPPASVAAVGSGAEMSGIPWIVAITLLLAIAGILFAGR